MAAIPEPSPPWYLIDTPQPNLFSIGIVVPMQEVGKSPDAWPTEGSTLEAFSLNPTPAIATQDLYGLYQYVGKSCVKSNVVFIFGPNKTDAEKNTPYRSYSETKNHRWPPILDALGIQQDYTFPNVTNVVSGNDSGIVTAPRNYPKRVYIPEVNEGTRFLTEEFFAATKFDIPRHAVPTPTAVFVDILDVSLSFPECLHPKITVPNTRTGDVTLVAGTAAGAGGALNGQVFPATNFETWAPYILTDQQELREGGWYRIRVRVFPPDLPDAIVR
jgi:hypothetical protein